MNPEHENAETCTCRVPSPGTVNGVFVRNKKCPIHGTPGEAARNGCPPTAAITSAATESAVTQDQFQYDPPLPVGEAGQELSTGPASTKQENAGRNLDSISGESSASVGEADVAFLHIREWIVRAGRFTTDSDDARKALDQLATEIRKLRAVVEKLGGAWIDGPPPDTGDGELIVVELDKSEFEYYGCPIIVHNYGHKLKTTIFPLRIECSSVRRWMPWEAAAAPIESEAGREG